MAEEKNKNYIDPKDFFREMLITLRDGKISDKLAMMFTLLSERYTNHRNFVRYTHLRDDFVRIGVVACCKGWPKFRVFKDKDNPWDGETIVEYDYKTCNNPFAYFTTCIRNDFFNFLTHEYNQSNIYNKIKTENDLEPEYGYTEMIKEQEEKERFSKVEDEEEEKSIIPEEDSEEEDDSNDGEIIW